MVDLAKIRRKAKKGAAADAAADGKQATGDGGASQNESAQPETPETTPAPREEVQAEASTPAPPIGSDEPPVTRHPSSKLEKFKEQAGKRRETRTEAQQIAEQHHHLELLTFVIAGEHYAVDIERIVEIVTPRPVTRIPNADPSVVGIISLRGTIVTLVDVRRKLRHPSAGEATADTRIVVVDFHGETVGFLVDRVLRVAKPGSDEIQPHPVVHISEQDDSVRGVFRADNDALTILLDLDKLLDSRALAAVSA